MASSSYIVFFFFFFNDTATTEIYTLSLHDALPISLHSSQWAPLPEPTIKTGISAMSAAVIRSEEHTSELQSQSNLVCRLLLEKKKLAPCSGRFRLSARRGYRLSAKSRHRPSST